MEFSELVYLPFFSHSLDFCSLRDPILGLLNLTHATDKSVESQSLVTSCFGDLFKIHCFCLLVI